MELVNIPLQAGLWFGLVDLPVTVPNLVGFSVLALLLVEGAGYWAAKLSQLRGRARGLPGERASPRAKPECTDIGMPRRAAG